MSNGEVRIPSRTLTEILAGTLDYYRASDRDEGPLRSVAWMKPYFASRLKQGRLIEEISLERCPEQDDDWIKIRYGPRDAAIAAFK